MKWTGMIRRIQNGMSVNEEIANMPIADLESRTDYLKAILDAYQAGHAMTHQDAPLTTATFQGAVVYWDAASSAYAPALSTYSVTAGGVVTPGAASKALGVVLEKTSTTVGTVCLIGYVDGVDITAATGVSPAAGTWYLSAVDAGKLVSTAPPLAVPIVELSSGTEFWVNSTPKSNSHEHQHYSFELEPWPAGIVDEPGEGDPYTFTEEWDTEPGWLPVDHANFTGLDVPADAVYGYNMEYDEDLAGVWPPSLTENANIYVNGLLQRSDQVVINDDGIWWMTDCPNAVPWVSGGSSDTCASSEIGCPPDWCDLHIQLMFTEIMGVTADAFVTSLTGVAPLEVVSCASLEAAVRGVLQVQLRALTTVPFASGSDMPSSAVVDMTRVQRTNGPLASGVRGTGRVTAVGTGAPVTGSDSRIYQTGGVTITVANADDAREGGVDVVALDDVGESEYSGNLYYRMINNMNSSVRGRVRVPINFLPTSPRMTLRFWLMGVSAGVLPALTLAYRRLPYSESTPQTLGTTDTSLTDILNGTPITTTVAYQYIVVPSDAFTVAAGDTVFFLLSRDSGDAYNADVGILNMRWTIAPAS